LRAVGSDHCWAHLTEGRRRALRYLSFGCFADDMARFLAHLARLAIERIAPPPGVDSDGVWICDCDGTPIEIKPAEKSSPSERPTFELAKLASAARACPARDEATRAHPRRLSHVLLFVRDLQRSIGFYRDALGLRLSDQVPGGVAFMHAPHGSDHHVL